MMKRRSRASRFQQFLKQIAPREKTREFLDRQAIYSQGDLADAGFYIRGGNVKLTVKSPNGKKAVIAILGRGDLFGTGCLAKRSLRQTHIIRVDGGIFGEECWNYSAIWRVI